MTVYEARYDNQREPRVFGLFSTKEKAVEVLKSYGADITKITYESTLVTIFDHDYIVEAKYVN